MVERQLRRRGITDERVLEAMAPRPASALRPGAPAPPRVRGRRACPSARGRRSRSRSSSRRSARSCSSEGTSACSTSERAPGTRRPCSPSSRRRWSRSSACPSSPSARGRRSPLAGYDRVEVRVGDGSLGVPDRAPFDAIAVAAAAPAIPPALYEQLVDGGRLVLPRGGRWGQELVLVERTDAAARSSARRSRAASSRSSAPRASPAADPSGGGCQRLRGLPSDDLWTPQRS